MSEAQTFRKSKREKLPLVDPTKVDRLPPHSIEAEQGILGCILLSPGECLNECIEKFKGGPELFYDLRHQGIYRALLDMHENQDPIDLISIQQKLKDRGQLDETGGIAYISSLPDAVPSAANLSYYAQIVHEKYLLRGALEIYVSAIRKVYDDDRPAEVVLLESEAELSALTEAQTTTAERHIKDVLDDVVKDMEEWHYMRGKAQLRGLPTGPAGNYLDKILLGLRETDYGVIAGRPGDGKSSLAMNIVEFLAKDYEFWEEITEAEFRLTKERNEKKTAKNLPTQPVTEVTEPSRKFLRLKKGIPVAVFSIEMDNESLGYRLLFGRAGVDMAEWNQGFATSDAQPRLLSAHKELIKASIYLDDTPAQSINQIAAKARRMAQQYGIKLFVLDYIQLVESDGGNGFDRVKELTKISRKIMALKKQLKVPWLVLAQMNRNIETSEAKRPPVMSDLKDCGAIEQDADKIVFLYKPLPKEMDKPNGENGPSDREILDRVAAEKKMAWAQKPYRMNAIVAKNRKGPTGIAKLVFCKNLTRFEDWHQWKVRHGVEEMKAGETTKGLGLPTDEELGRGA